MTLSLPHGSVSSKIAKQILHSDTVSVLDLAILIGRYFSWMPDPRASAIDALAHSWIGIAGYAPPPPFLSGGSLSVQGQGGEESDCVSDSDMVEPVMVPSPPPNVDRQPSPATHESSDLDLSPGGSPPFTRERHFGSSRVENLRRCYSSEGFSEEVRELLLHAWRSGTKSSYDCAWKKWDCWCRERQICFSTFGLCVSLLCMAI